MTTLTVDQRLEVLLDTTNERRKRVVLRYPDLAAELTKHPYRGDPQLWEGFVPPANVRGDARRNGLEGPVWKRNDSPFREQLYAIVAAAAERAVDINYDNTPPRAWAGGAR